MLEQTRTATRSISKANGADESGSLDSGRVGFADSSQVFQHLAGADV
jgi:hypothetical protein